ncbi:uncharacterized protein [Euphorbia lathyris]|uniref:uncharacterized protein isoform X2 n=1 Tax=Euphorbia lathyris TaxID=212925 RepID=UPI0033130D2A
MALFLKSKSSLLSRLKTLPSLQVQRLNHTITEPKNRSPRKKEGYDDFVIEMSKWKKINASHVGISRSQIPLFAWTVLNQLHNRGFQAYLVGGCVRDFLLNKEPKDFDVVTTAELKQVKKAFSNCLIVGRRFPICRVQIKDSVVEVSSFKTRAEHSKDNENQQLPKMPVGCDENDFICWRDSIHRDFTINSLFYDPFLNKICDYANCMQDIKTLKLRTLKPAHLSFQEDRARILRGLRIAGRLGLSISKDTEVAICEFASSVKDLDKGRIMMELNYMLSYGAAESTIYLLRRFNLLELFLPFQAAYLDHQFRKTSSLGSVMLMKLFFNLDKLVTCDRPCHCNLWLGLLAFHQALVNNPQDAFVVWVFASVLCHGRWKEGVKFARENAKLQVNFVPEISGFSDFKSDDELSSEVSHLAALVQKSVCGLVNAKYLVESMKKYQDSSSSPLVFVPNKAGDDVVRLFDVLVDDIETYKHGRQSSMINYKLLGKGIRIESRFVLGKIIMETLRGGLVKEMQFTMEEEEVIEKKYAPKHSDPVNHGPWVSKDKKRSLYPFDSEQKENIPKKQKVQKVQPLSEGIAPTREFVLSKDESRKTVKKPTKVVETKNLTEGESTETLRQTLKKQKHTLQKKHGTIHNENILPTESKLSNLSKDDDKIKREVKSQGVVKEKSSRPSLQKKHGTIHNENILPTESKLSNLSKDDDKIKREVKSQGVVVKEKSSRPSLSSLFGR